MNSESGTWYKADSSQQKEGAETVPYRGTILFAENDAARVGIMTYLLNSIGFDVYHIQNGLDAVEAFLSQKATKTSFVLIVTDWEMPKMNGIEAVAQIRKIDPNVPILMMSTKDPDDQVQEAISRGDMQFLSKEADVDEIVARVLSLTSDEHEEP